MRKLILTLALMLSGCGLAPDRTKCATQFTSMTSRAATFTVGSSTKDQVRTAIGTPTTDYVVADHQTSTTVATTIGSQLGYRLYENGTESSNSCGFFYFTFNTSNVLNPLTKVIEPTGPTTTTVAATVSFTQY